MAERFWNSEKPLVLNQPGLEQRLKEYPELKAKIETMLAIIENAGGDAEKAAEAVAAPQLNRHIPLYRSLWVIRFQPGQLVNRVHCRFMMFFISTWVMCGCSDFPAQVGHSFPA
jgi:hypothetical protein